MIADLDIISGKFLGERLVPLAANLAAEGIRANIADREQFQTVQPEVGEPVGPVLDISPQAYFSKVAAQLPFPDLPRFGTGRLYESIGTSQTGLTALAGPTLVEHAERMQGGWSSPWTNYQDEEVKARVPARPFIGISDKRLKMIEDAENSVADRELAELLNAVEFEPITVRVGG